MSPSLNTSSSGHYSGRLGTPGNGMHNATRIPLKRQRTRSPEDDAAESTSRARDADAGPGDRRRMLMKDLLARSERVLTSLFTGQGTFAPNEPLVNDATATTNIKDEPSSPKRTVRKIDEDDYGDEDEGDEQGEASPLHGKGSSTTTSLSSLSKSTTVEKLTPQTSVQSSKNAEEVRKELEAEKKAAEDAARDSFWELYYTLENDRDAMLEQQKLDELDREVETDISEQQKDNIQSQDPNARQGTLSSANLGSSSLALKHLIAKIDVKRNLVKATDTQLRILMSEVRKNRSKWANEEKVGQEELYESAERVLMDLKARTEYSTPFLQRVNKREAPDYYQIIKYPMDIGTMIKKLKQLQYHSKKQFVDDLELIWSNCLKYNGSPSHPLRRKAEHMRELARNLTRLIPDIVVRDRAEVEAEERRLHPEFDDAEESEEEPLMSTRGRKAPGGKTSKKGTTSSRKGLPTDSTQTESQAPQVTSIEMKERANTTPPPGDHTPVVASAAPPSQADGSEVDGGDLLIHGVTHAHEEQEEEDEEYLTWKQVTKKDRARVAAERHRLFVAHRINPEEPALLRTKAGMRRLQKMQRDLTLEEPGVIVPTADIPAQLQTSTLAEGMSVDEDSVLPDYYEPLHNIPALDERLCWTDDRDGFVIDKKEECLRILATEQFRSPRGHFASRMEKNIKQMQDTRKIVAKIAVVKQMQIQAQTYQNQFQKYEPPPLDEVDVEPAVVTDEGPLISTDLCRATLQRAIGKIFYHAGFEDFQPSALEAITDIATNYLSDITSQLCFYGDSTWLARNTVSVDQDHPLQSRFSGEEAVLHTLQTFSHDVELLDSYVKEDLDRTSSRLESHHSRTRDYLAELLRPALDPNTTGADGVGAFNDGSEQFVGGDFAEDLDEDFFGFRELGLDREFGLSNLSVPLHLLQSRVHNAYQPTSSAAAGNGGQLMEQPVPYAPITIDNLKDQVGLVRDFFAKRLEANDDDVLIEDDELPLKQRYPKPRLPPTGKISSPRKRPIREQQQMARKRRRLEAEAEKEREREREAGTNDVNATRGASLTAVGTVNGVGADEHGLGNGLSPDEDVDMNGMLLKAGESQNGVKKVKLGLPKPSERDNLINGDPEKKTQESRLINHGKGSRDQSKTPNGLGKRNGDFVSDASNDDNGDADNERDQDQDQDKDHNTGILSPESVPIAAH